MDDDQDGLRGEVSGALDALATGFRKRTFATMRLVGRVGMSMAKRNFGLAGAMEAIDEEKAIAAARKLVAELDSMKGLAMKVGQMMSYLDGSLPPKAQRILAALQSASTPMSAEKIAEVIRAELGAAPEEIFDRFEPAPFAAASIGQVHRAEKDGAAWAVKVQYPGIETLIRSDLKTFGRFMRMVTAFSPSDGKGLAEELERRLLLECDYLAEADSQERFRVLFTGRTDITVPAVRRDLCRRRVLTTELVRDRWTFDEFRGRAAQAVRDRAAGLLYEAYIQPIFRHGVYNADPHPGNYLFAPDGSVTLLDFGCVKYFDRAFVDRWKRLVRSILHGDRAAFRAAWADCGFVGRKGFDFDHQYEAMRAFYAPVLGTEPTRVDHAYVAETYDLLMFKNANRFKLKLPPDWLFVNRLQWGLFSVLARLEGAAPWGRILRDAIA